MVVRCVRQTGGLLPSQRYIWASCKFRRLVVAVARHLELEFSLVARQRGHTSVLDRPRQIKITVLEGNTYIPQLNLFYHTNKNF